MVPSCSDWFRQALAPGETVRSNATIPSPTLDLFPRRLDLLVDVDDTNVEPDESNSYQVELQMCFPADMAPHALTLSLPLDQVRPKTCASCV